MAQCSITQKDVTIIYEVLRSSSNNPDDFILSIDQDSIQLINPKLENPVVIKLLGTS
jgi:hypothetical protein